MSVPTQLRKIGFVLAGAFAFVATPLAAQSIESIDPSNVIDGDFVEQPGDLPVYSDVESAAQTVTDAHQQATSSVESWNIEDNAVGVASEWSDPGTGNMADSVANAAGTAVDNGKTYGEDDLIGAAEGVFGKGAEGVARLIQDLLSKQGEPNAYIVGREAGGAFFLGARYGSGTLFHKVEGKKPVYWTGPSIGFDVGANVGNTFVLVYNLYDTEELYSRYPAGEGQAYMVGGLAASYLRKGDKVLIPIRVGAGLRLGVNAGYMKFSKKQRWLPF